MKRLSGGIDVGSESHHITILDEEDNILYNQKVSHKLSEFTESIKLFKQIEKKEKGEISFALEGKNGYSAPLDRKHVRGTVRLTIINTRHILAHIKVRSCSIIEYFSVHYSTVNRVMKGIEQRDKKGYSRPRNAYKMIKPGNGTTRII